MVLLAWALPAVAHPTRAAGTTVNVVAGKPSEYHFTLSVKSVKTGTVTFKLSNTGTVPHDLKLCSSPKGGHAMSCTGHAYAPDPPRLNRDAQGDVQDSGNVRVPLHLPRPRCA